MVMAQPRILAAQTVAMGILLFLVHGILWSSPGDIISIEHEIRYSRSEIEDFIAPLYDGYDIADAQYSVDVYQIVYESSYPDGSPAQVHAQVFLPVFVESTPVRRSLYVFAPGSTGLIDNCRPSREHEAGIRWGLYRAHVLSHAGQGSIGILPDYMGFRDSSHYQLYMVAQAEGALLLDAIRVMDAVYEQTGYASVSETLNVAGGFSQGGHAILAAADMRSSYAPEIRLDAVIGFGATADPLQLMLEYPSVAPMIVYTYSGLYGRDAVDPYRILRQQYAEYLADDVLSQCVGAMSAYYPHHAEELYTEEFYQSLTQGTMEQDYPEFAKVTALNTVGYQIHGTEVLLMQGTDDIVIFPQTQRAYARALEQQGVQVQLRIFQGARHDSRQVSFSLVRDWIDDQLNRFSDFAPGRTVE